MKVKVTSIRGFDDMFVTMFISKRHWNWELDEKIRGVCDRVVDSNGRIRPVVDATDMELFTDWLGKALRIGKNHITILRFLDIAIMTEGLHRAGQDDVDSHAVRFNNRIIRTATAHAKFLDGELSEWYQDKVLTTNQVLEILGIETPESFTTLDGDTYVKCNNGYVKKEYKDNGHVTRGLNYQGFPSDFKSKINLCEWGHVYGLRNNNGHANPEVKIWAESVMEQITQFHKQITSDYVLSIKN